MADDQLTPAEIAEDRIKDFQEQFGGTQFFEIGVMSAINNSAQLLSAIFGKRISDAAFDLMLRQAFQQDSGSWEEILEEECSGFYSETRIGELVHDLSAYADYGVVLDSAKSAEHRHALLAKKIEEARNFLVALPDTDWELRQEDLIKILKKAFARWKIDNDQSINAEELSLLSGRALQTIKNNLGNSKNPKRIMGSYRRIEADQANAFLNSIRGDGFKESIWREQDDTIFTDPSDSDLESVHFVPVAIDGTIFHPGLKRDGYFQIETKQGEEQIESFDVALQHLQHIAQPRWKRPTPGGSWTFARGIEWRRMTLEELKVLPAP